MPEPGPRTTPTPPRKWILGLGRRQRASAPPASSGPDEETVAIAQKAFRKRRHADRWRLARRVVAAALVVALIAGAAWLVLFSSYVTARDVEVSGAGTVGEKRVNRAAEVPVGRPLARVDLDAIRARVESIAAVRRVEVSRSWPHTVRIAVSERIPVAVVDRGTGLRALDVEGVLFGGYDKQPRSLPLVRSGPDTKSEALAEAAAVLESLPSTVLADVQTLEVETVDEVRLVLEDGRRVLWGSAEDSEQKAEVLGVLLQRPGQQFDVSVPGRPTTR